MTVIQATFIGVGSMVGAGIFALLGAAGAVAGSAVWVSFLLAGAIAGLQGYSFAKLGAMLPIRGRHAHLPRPRGSARATSPASRRGSSTRRPRIVTAMVATPSATTPARCSTDDDPTWAKVFAVADHRRHDRPERVGSSAVARVQSLIVKVVLTILTVFAVVTLVNVDLTLLAPVRLSRALQDIIASVALTFFAFLGFGVITFTAKDLPDPARQLPEGDVPRPGDRHHGLRRRRARACSGR